MRKIAFYSILFIVTCKAEAQIYLGLTGDYGARLEHPHSGSLIKSSSMPSGSIELFKQHIKQNDLIISYGIGLGVQGYRIDASEADSIRNDPDFYDPRYDYSLFYTSAHVNIGKQFKVKGKKINLLFGGGGTYYFEPFGITHYSGRVWTGTSYQKVFDFEMQPAKKKIRGFGEIQLQIPISSRFLIGARYRYHFNAAVEGEYSIRQQNKIVTGGTSLTQRFASVIFMMRIGQ